MLNPYRPKNIAPAGSEPRAQRTVLDERYSARVQATVTLARVTAGYEPAGAGTRWTDGHYSVLYRPKGSASTHGARYTNAEAARAHFRRLTEQ